MTAKLLDVVLRVLEDELVLSNKDFGDVKPGDLVEISVQDDPYRFAIDCFLIVWYLRVFFVRMDLDLFL